MEPIAEPGPQADSVNLLMKVMPEAARRETPSDERLAPSGERLALVAIGSDAPSTEEPLVQMRRAS